MNRSRPVDAADAAWLRMDHPTNRMTIVAVLTFDQPMDIASMRTLIASRLLRFDRFRCRVTTRGGNLHWQEDSDFSIDRHVTAARLPEPGDEGALQAFVGDVMSEALPADRPPGNSTWSSDSDQAAPWSCVFTTALRTALRSSVYC